MDTSAIKAIMAEIAPVIREYFDEEVAPLRAELAALRAQEPVQAGLDAETVKAIVDEAVSAIPLPEKGEPGEAVEPDEVKRMIEQAVSELPPPEKGEDGKNVEPDEVKRLIDEAVSALPPAEKGEDGKSVDAGEVKAMVEEAVAALPPAEKGDAGKDADPAEIKRMVAEAVSELPPAQKGDAGKDGVGLAGAMIDRDGELVITLTNGETKSLGAVVGKDGDPGRDGLGFDDLSVEQIGERTIKFLLTRGSDAAEFDVTIPVPIYRGVFSEKAEYAPGDMVTWAGSTWHCKEPKGLKPGATDSGWVLAVKAGRPGKDK